MPARSLHSPPPPFAVRNASRFLHALAKLGPHLEPLLEWALPQFVARGCLEASEEQRCQRASNPRSEFLSCLQRRSAASLELLVQQLHSWGCFGILQQLRASCTPRSRLPSEARARSWNLPVPALHYTRRSGLWNLVEPALCETSESDGHWILLSGIAACGKSSVAVEAAYTALEDSSLSFDHVVWLKASDTDDDAVIGQALAALTYGLDGRCASSLHDFKTLHNQMEMAAYARQRTEKILLVLDDVWEESIPMKFTAFSHTIVTSRNAEILRLTGLPFTHIEVPEALTRDESLTVSRAACGKIKFYPYYCHLFFSF